MSALLRALAVWAAILAPSAWAADADHPPVESMASRVLACTACHGREGRATPGGYFPRIAGKPAGYLYHQLLNFRDGRRSYPPMSYLLEHLTDDYLREIAEHFAALDLPYAPPPSLRRPLPPCCSGGARSCCRAMPGATSRPACTAMESL